MIFICSALGDLRKTMLLSLFNKIGISILQNARYKIFANVLPKKGHIQACEELSTSENTPISHIPFTINKIRFPKIFANDFIKFIREFGIRKNL